MADPYLAWAFVGAGAFGQFMAALLARRSLGWLKKGGRAVGRVVRNEEEMVERREGPSRMFYFPIIEFESDTGVRTVFQSDTGRPVPLAVGQTLPVVFDPSKPDAARTATFRTLWLFPLLTSVLTLPILIFGLAALT